MVINKQGLVGMDSPGSFLPNLSTTIFNYFFPVPGPDYNISVSGTCKLEKVKFDYIRTKDNCTSKLKYLHNRCMGSCDSSSNATYGETGVETFCSCCQPAVGQLKTATLTCQNGETRVTNFLEIRSCRCRQYKCISEPDKGGMEEINEKGQKVEVNQQGVGRRRRR